MRARTQGFSLLELSIVLVIIGLITGIGIAASIGALDAAKSSATATRMDEIERALQAFRNKNNRLPCPADVTLTNSSSSYGIEGANPGFCTTGSPAAALKDTYVAEGGVPTETLGLPESYMYDGWGRKIVYAVDINATYKDAFAVIKPDEFCKISVKDAGGGYITGNGTYTSGAIYSLVSFGPNGHGGYTRTGTKMSSGSTDTSEYTNCHCDSTGATAAAYDHATYIRKEETSTFDDIVRFKERWQMQNEDDGRNFRNYSGPDMALTLLVNSATNVKLFETNCGLWTTFTGTSPANLANANAYMFGTAFTGDDSHLLVFFNGACYYYKITNNVVGSAALANTNLTCPGQTGGPINGFSMSKTGYLAISGSASPYVNMWKESGDQFFAFSSTSPATVLSTTPPSQPNKVVLSQNGNFLGLSRTVGVYTYFYARTGDKTYTRMTDPVPATQAGAIAFSPNEQYMAMAVSGASSVRIWSITTANQFSGLVTTLGGPVIATNIVNYSPDGQYMIVAGGAPNTSAGYSDKLKIYKVDGETYTDITPTGNFSYSGGLFRDAAFSPDSNFLIMPTAGSGTTTRGVIFRRTGVNSFVEMTSPLTATLNAGEESLYIKFAY